jgi:RimJ/RimL family protein N-acetyltransferase
MEPVFLRGASVSLTALGPGDISEDYLAWLNDADVLRYRTAKVFPTTMSQLKEWVEQIPLRGDLVLAIRADEGKKHIGNIALNSIWWAHRSAELAIMIGSKEVWGRGYGKEAIELLTSHAFKTMGLNSLWARSPNPSFNAAVAKLGWIKEGTQREAFMIDGKFTALECWGLLASEWKPDGK